MGGEQLRLPRVKHWSWECLCATPTELESVARTLCCWGHNWRKYFHDWKINICIAGQIGLQNFGPNHYLAGSHENPLNLRIGLLLCQLNEYSSSWLMQLVGLRGTMATNRLMNISAASNCALIQLSVAHHSASTHALFSLSSDQYFFRALLSTFNSIYHISTICTGTIMSMLPL